MFITKKRLCCLEKRTSDLEKAQSQPKKVDLDAIKRAVSESIARTGKNPFQM